MRKNTHFVFVSVALQPGKKHYIFKTKVCFLLVKRRTLSCQLSNALCFMFKVMLKHFLALTYESALMLKLLLVLTYERFVL